MPASRGLGFNITKTFFSLNDRLGELGTRRRRASEFIALNRSTRNESRLSWPCSRPMNISSGSSSICSISLRSAFRHRLSPMLQSRVPSWSEQTLDSFVSTISRQLLLLTLNHRSTLTSGTSIGIVSLRRLFNTTLFLWDATLGHFSLKSSLLLTSQTMTILNTKSFDTRLSDTLSSLSSLVFYSTLILVCSCLIRSLTGLMSGTLTKFTLSSAKDAALTSLSALLFDLPSALLYFWHRLSITRVIALRTITFSWSSLSLATFHTLLGLWSMGISTPIKETWLPGVCFLNRRIWVPSEGNILHHHWSFGWHIVVLRFKSTDFSFKL